MSEPVRLLSDPDASSFERSVLASWSSEQPTADARARALGLAGVAAAAAAGAAVAPKVASAGLSVLAKWLLLGVVLLGAGAGTVTLALRPSASEPASAARAAPIAPPAPPPPSVVGAAAPAETAAPVSAISPEDLPSVAAAPSARGAAPAAANAPAASTGRDASLAEEIALFDRARAALDAGDADRALALLDAYEGRFRRGAFVQEAEVLRVQALVRKGDTAGAARVGQRFLAAHPTSPHAARIRAILGTSER